MQIIKCLFLIWELCQPLCVFNSIYICMVIFLFFSRCQSSHLFMLSTSVWMLPFASMILISPYMLLTIVNLIQNSKCFRSHWTVGFNSHSEPKHIYKFTVHAVEMHMLHMNECGQEWDLFSEIFSSEKNGNFFSRHRLKKVLFFMTLCSQKIYSIRSC